ncbi:MAG: hypothetical protein HY741_24800 [Chloroflexi bacterium]|nr:hypothetical protein [Chloroflexota bacterium]
MKSSRFILGVLVLVLLTSVIVACGQASASKMQPPAKRVITLAAIEPKGSTTVEKEPFPSEALPEGGGYALVKPDDKGTWVVETYRWDSSTVVVNEGDDVTLEVIGINGKEHPTTIEGYNVNFAVQRGKLTKVNFKADKPGIFKIICSAHQPSMTADLVVLAR